MAGTYVRKPGAARSIRDGYAGGKKAMDGVARSQRSRYGTDRPLRAGQKPRPKVYRPQKGSARSIRDRYAKNPPTAKEIEAAKKKGEVPLAALNKGSSIRSSYGPNAPAPGEAGGPPLDIKAVSQKGPKGPTPYPAPKPQAAAPTAPRPSAQPDKSAALEAKLDMLLAMMNTSEAARLETQRQLDAFVHSKGNKADLEPRVRAALIAAGEDVEDYFAHNPTKDDLKATFGVFALGMTPEADDEADDSAEAAGEG